MCNDEETINSSELKTLLERAFTEMGYHFNIEGIIKNNAKLLNNTSKTHRRFIPLLPRFKSDDKSKHRYRYHILDVENFINEYIAYHNGSYRVREPPKITAINGIGLSDLLESFDDGRKVLMLTDGLTVYTGTMFKQPTTVIVTKTGEFYYLTDEERGGEYEMIASK